jgi:hypothetical protein
MSNNNNEVIGMFILHILDSTVVSYQCVDGKRYQRPVMNFVWLYPCTARHITGSWCASMPAWGDPYMPLWTSWQMHLAPTAGMVLVHIHLEAVMSADRVENSLGYWIRLPTHDESDTVYLLFDGAFINHKSAIRDCFSFRYGRARYA